MSFDKETRNLLAKTVTACRRRLTEDVIDQLQGVFGMHPDGTVLPLDKLTHLSPDQAAAARRLRDLLDHYTAGAAGKEQERRKAAYERMVLEISFTALNRLAALRLCEERGLIVECVRKGTASDGFRLFERISGGALGTRYDAYRVFLECMFDELGLDLGVLFDRLTPQSAVFPGERCLEDVLAELNKPELTHLWTEDETIGWIYQYFNPPEERKKMREESAAPRNSRELAVRNQFFTPRYVVEFLTDNTLGRIWYEMRRGDTALKEECRYLVRRPCEVFLSDGHLDTFQAGAGVRAAARGDFSRLPEEPTWDDLQALALCLDGYQVAPLLGFQECSDLHKERLEEYRSTGAWRGNAAELWCCLFFEQRKRRWAEEEPEGEDLEAVKVLYRALRGELTADTSELSQEELLKRPVFIPPRPCKDPRDLKILDPACGSGHFLLYAFDLLETIYAEAWDEQYAVCRRLYAEGEDDERKELPGSVRLAEGDGFGGNDLPGHEGLSEGGTLRLDGANPQSGGFDTFEHSGRTRSDIEQGVPKLSVDSPRIGAGSRNADFDRSAAAIPAGPKSAGGFGTGGRGRTIDHGALEVALQEIGYHYADSAYRPLPTAYPSLEDLRRAAPELILRHNLHGIDIDPRAVQIAALALWLRAQKSWKNQGLKSIERPPITKSNIVTAEPMPGEEDLRREFTAGLRPRVLGRLVDAVFDKMKLAGEAGSLLKIEEEIKEAVAEAKKLWLEAGKPEQQAFPGVLAARPKQEKLHYDLKEITDEGFWEEAEERILAALQEYAERTENGRFLRRRLFAQDAARGFAFIDLCHKVYDVLIMNPPFGSGTNRTLSIFKSVFPISYNNLGAAFIDRMCDLQAKHGLLGGIIDYSIFVRSSYEKFRRVFLYSKARLRTICHSGWNVLDSNVETCFFTLEKAAQYYGDVFCWEASNENDKAKFILSNIDKPLIASISEFESFPNGVPNFTLPGSIRKLFSRLVTLDPNYAEVRTGLSTGDNERFYKLIWEYEKANTGWHFLSNGGEFSPFYRPTQEIIDWRKDGLPIRELRNIDGTLKSRPQNLDYNLLAGLSYGKRGTFLAVHTHPAKRFFTNEGQGIFPKDNGYRNILLGLLNSRLLRLIINEYCGQHKENGYVSLLPISMPISEEYKNIDEIVYIIINELRDIQKQRIEHAESIVYYGHGPISLNDMTKLQLNKIHEIRSKLRKLEIELNNLIEKHYMVGLEGSIWLNNASSIMPPIDSAIDLFPWDEISLCSEKIDSMVGIVFGRWDIRISKNFSLAPKLPDPFDPLPVCPPGMLVGPDGLPAEPGRIVSEAWLRKRAEGGMQYAEGKWTIPDGDDSLPTALCLLPTDADYPLRISWDGVLVDDPGFNGAPPHREDIVRRVREVLDLIWKDKAPDIEQEACDILGVADLREYFRRPGGFFQDHLKRYSKSRRKAPIYWPLSTASGSYTVWLYYHRLTDQTLYLVVNRYVEPKIAEVERALARLEDELASASGRDAARLRDQLNEGRTFLGELRDFREELLRVAALPYKPNLNDGVIINAAPLHKLFRLRSWAKDTEECWKKLQKGDYDWAHLAYTVWPDRVREVCKKDRSIAIAHGLEDICEVKPPEARKQRGKGRRKRKSVS